MGKAQADRESAVRHTFWRMSIYRRPAIRLRRTIGPPSAAGGLKPLLTEIMCNRAAKIRVILKFCGNRKQAKNFDDVRTAQVVPA
jgi:hypothetical protein